MLYCKVRHAAKPWRAWCVARRTWYWVRIEHSASTELQQRFEGQLGFVEMCVAGDNCTVRFGPTVPQEFTSRCRCSLRPGWIAKTLPPGTGILWSLPHNFLKHNAPVRLYSCLLHFSFHTMARHANSIPLMLTALVCRLHEGFTETDAAKAESFVVRTGRTRRGILREGHLEIR